MSDALPADLQPVAPTLRMSRPLAIDLGTSYLLAVTRVAVAAIIVGILYRYTTVAYVAVFVLARSMLSVINLLFAGVGPATLHELHRADRVAKEPQNAVPIAEPEQVQLEKRVALEYETPRAPELWTPPFSLHTHAWLVVFPIAMAVFFFVWVVYSEAFGALHGLPPQTKLESAAATFIGFFAFGLLARVASDPAGAKLQAVGRLWVDNILLSGADVLWLAVAVISIEHRHASTLIGIGTGYAISGGIVCCLRMLTAPKGPLLNGMESIVMLRRWLKASAIIALGSMSDLLYGTASVLIINQYLSRETLAHYAPAMQIDGALLLCVAAISAVLLPRASSATASGDHAQLRRMFLAAMGASLVLLAVGSAIVLLLRRPLLSAWLGTVPPETLAILPLVLIHTIIGGTAGVGRAMLLGMGRFHAYTTSAIVGGVANVALALTFVLGFDLGLRGVVLATIIAVTIRCAIWMPWYILRSLR